MADFFWATLRRHFTFLLALFLMVTWAVIRVNDMSELRQSLTDAKQSDVEIKRSLGDVRKRLETYREEQIRDAKGLEDLYRERSCGDCPRVLKER